MSAGGSSSSSSGGSSKASEGGSSTPSSKVTGPRGTETIPGGERQSSLELYNDRDRSGNRETHNGPGSARLSKGAAMVEKARREREMCTKTEMTPLMIAAARGHDDIVKVLLNHGATS